MQCLAYIKLLLQQLPSGRPVPDEGAAVSFDSLWEMLLLLALKQEQPEIRWALVSSAACVVHCTCCTLQYLCVTVLGGTHVNTDVNPEQKGELVWLICLSLQGQSSGVHWAVCNGGRQQALAGDRCSAAAGPAAAR
jgi:hypothetical protein